MKIRITALIFIMIMAIASQAFAGTDAKLEVGTKLIDINTFYNGTSLKVSGSVPEGCEAVLRFIGSSSELHMKEKGKAMGILWMNLNSLTFRNAPGVFLVNTSETFSKSDENGGTMKKIGLSSLRDSIRVEADKTDKTLAVDELLKLKQQEGLYNEVSGNILYLPGMAGQKAFKAEISVPSRLLPGEYSIELLAVQGGQIVSQAKQNITADLSGFPKLMSSLAFGNSLLYGVLATVIAIFSGLGIGMVFQSKGAH